MNLETKSDSFLFVLRNESRRCRFAFEITFRYPRESNKPVTSMQDRKGIRQVDRGGPQRSNMIASDGDVRGDGQSVDQEIAKLDISYICSSVNAFAKYVPRIYDLQPARGFSSLLHSRSAMPTLE